jgi:hypothetical protein
MNMQNILATDTLAIKQDDRDATSRGRILAVEFLCQDLSQNRLLPPMINASL